MQMHTQVDAMLKLREQINSAGASAGGKISVNDFVVKVSRIKVYGRDALIVNAFVP